LRQPPIRQQAFARFRRRLASGNGLFLPDRAGRAAFARSGRRRCGTGRRAGRGLRRLFAGRPVFPVGSFRFGRFVVLLAHIDIHFPREAAETPLLEGFVRLEALALKDVAAFVLDDLRIDVRIDALRLGIPEELLGVERLAVGLDDHHVALGLPQFPVS